MCNCKAAFTDQWQIKIIEGSVYLKCLIHNEVRSVQVGGVSPKNDYVDQSPKFYSNNLVIKTT
jgi:hypothetical protein